MKKNRSILCALLVTAMVSAFGACDKEPDTEISAVPIKTVAEKAGANGSVFLDFSDGNQNLIITSPEEYTSRPKGIQPGTVLNYLEGGGLSDFELAPWMSYRKGWVSGIVYESLLYMYMNDPEDIRGCIAESWTHSDDYLTWTFQIRDGVMFTDGTVCDAHAISKSWDYAQIVGSCHIASWEAVNAKEFVIHMSAPCAYFEVALSGNSPLLIASPTALELYGANDMRAAVGTGPYYIESFDRNTRYVLKANENYYLEEKTPCIETVNLLIISYPSDVLQALLDGGLDGAVLDSAFGFEGSSGSEPSDVERCHALLDGGYGGRIVRCLGYANPIWLNEETVPLFQTKEVRQAMIRFIDFSSINGRIYEGMGRVLDSIWAAGSSGYVRTDQYYYDPAEGHELLAAVGLETSDIAFSVVLWSRYQREGDWEPGDMITALRDELDKAGVSIDFKVEPPESAGYATSPSAFLSGIPDYTSSAPYAPWAPILHRGALSRQCWQDIYDPELYQKMLSEYDAMTAAATWNEMLVHCRQLTAYVQDDFASIGGIQSPAFLVLGNEFKNAVYFTERHYLQLYYLYQE